VPSLSRSDAFRLHFQRVVLGSLAQSLEEEAGARAGVGPIGRARARRAEQEARRLREVLESLGREDR
jgi:hypothetical protein